MNILIIGATSGIGRSLYRHYISNGNNVAIMGRRKDVLDELYNANPSSTLPFTVDISDCKAFTDAFSKCAESMGTIDMAIICAGIGELNPNLEISQELRVLATNVSGWTNVIDTLFHYFESRKAGHIVAITSIGGLQPNPVAPSYSASKAFQIIYTKSIQAKAKHKPFYITEIRPGLVDTRMAKGDGLFWVMPLEKVCKQIIRAIDKKRKLCIVTKRWRPISFFLKHFM